MRHLEIRIITDEANFDSLNQEWNTLAWASNTYIFQTFEWNRTWWEHFGTTDKLYLILFYSENRLIGIAPFFKDTYQIIGKTVYSALRLIGSVVSQPKGEVLIGLSSYSDYLDIIVEPAFEENVAQALVDFLKKKNLQKDEIIFDEAHEKSFVINHFLPVLIESGLVFEIEKCSTCTTISLTDSWDSYLSKLSKNSRKKNRKYLNEIEEKKPDGFNLNGIHDSDELLVAFDELVKLHQKQWNHRGFPGTFYEKRMYEFTSDICSQFYKNGWLMIEKLTSIDNRNDTINAEMFFTYKKRMYSVHGGTDTDSPHLHRGVGNITFTKVLKQAIENGFETFDYLRGDEDYKVSRADHIYSNMRIIIQNAGPLKSIWIYIIKLKINIFRRARVEIIQFMLSFRNRKLIEGFRAYQNFISNRITAKRKSKPLIISG